MTKRKQGKALIDTAYRFYNLSNDSRQRDDSVIGSWRGGLLAILFCLTGCSPEQPEIVVLEEAQETKVEAKTSKVVEEETENSAVLTASVEKVSNPEVVPPTESQAASLKNEAVAAAIKISAAYPANALTHVLLGSAYYNTGRSDEATKHLIRGLELRPDMLEAHEMLARIAYEKGEPEETVRLCQKALKHGPATDELLIQMGKSQMDLGETESAIQTLQKAVERPQAKVESLYLLGQAHMQSRQYEKAKTNFLKAIQRLPDHTQAYFGLFTASQRLGQTDEAVKYQEQFLKLESIDRNSLTDRSGEEDTLSGMSMVRETVARTLFGAAQIHQSQGANADAVRLFLRAASLHPDNFGFRSALEGFFVRNNDVVAGVRGFEKLVAEQPENVLNHYFLGRMETRTKNFVRAEECFIQVQKLMPEWASGYEALAELYLGSKQEYDAARKLAGRAIDLDPNGYRYYLLALISLRTNDQAGALEAAKRAALLSPRQQKYAQLLQQLQGAQGGAPAKP